MDQLLKVAIASNRRGRPAVPASRTAACAAAAVVVALGTTTAGAAAGHPGAAARGAGHPVRGVDISAYQHANGPINWRRLVIEGIRFVAVKASEGTYYTNPYYQADTRAAARAGLAVMPYVFANPRQGAGAATALFTVRTARFRGGRGALPIVVDLENNPYGGGICYGLAGRRMVSWIAGFTSLAEKLTGRPPIIYTTAAWWRQCTGSTRRFGRDPLWLAAYAGTPPVPPPPWHRWTFLQYSDTNTVPGIGAADLDYYHPTAQLPTLHPGGRRAPRKSSRPEKRHKPAKHHGPVKKHEPVKRHKPVSSHKPRKVRGAHKPRSPRHSPKPKPKPKPKNPKRPKHPKAAHHPAPRQPKHPKPPRHRAPRHKRPRERKSVTVRLHRPRAGWWRG